MMPAVAPEVAVDPACSMTDWWAPERFTENSTNDPSGDCANRTSDHKAGTRPGSRANRIGACGRRHRSDCDNHRYCEQKMAHDHCAGCGAAERGRAPAPAYRDPEAA